MPRIHLIYPTHLLDIKSKYSVPRILAFLASELQLAGIDVVVWNTQSSHSVHNYQEKTITMAPYVQWYHRFEYRFLSRVRNSHFSWWVKKIGRILSKDPKYANDFILCATYQSVIDLRSIGVTQKVMLWSHGIDYNNINLNINAINKCNVLFIASEAFLEQLYSLFKIKGIYVPIFKVGNPFNKEDYKYLSPLPENNLCESKSQLTYFYGGGTLERKGYAIIELLLTKWRPGRQTVLIIAGHGISQSRTEQFGNLNVTYKPFLDAQQLQQELQSADIFLMPSLWFENYPMLMFEALFFGLIPVISGNGGGKEMFDNDLGFIIDYPNAIEEWLVSFSVLEQLDRTELDRRKKLLAAAFRAKDHNSVVISAFKDYILS